MRSSLNKDNMHSKNFNLTNRDVDFEKTSLRKFKYFLIEVCTTRFIHEYLSLAINY